MSVCIDVYIMSSEGAGTAAGNSISAHVVS